VVFTLLYAVSEWKRTRALTSTDLEVMLYGRILERDLLIAESGELADLVLGNWEAWLIADAARRPEIGWTGNQRFYDPSFIQYVESRVDWP
jgi:hypothetical protein